MSEKNLKLHSSKYDVFVDDRGRYHADVKNKKPDASHLLMDTKFKYIFKNQNQELNGQDSYGALYIPEDNVNYFKSNFLKLENKLKVRLEKPLSVELKSTNILTNIKPKKGLFLNKSVTEFYDELINLIAECDGYFRLFRLDWVNVFIIKRFSNLIENQTITSLDIKSMVKYMYQYASDNLKSDLFFFDVNNKSFLNNFLSDIDMKTKAGNSSNNPYANSRVDWLLNLRAVLLKCNVNGDKLSFSHTYEEIESEFLSEEILFFAKHDTIRNVEVSKIYSDVEINIDSASVVQSEDDLGFGIRVVDYFLGYLNKSMLALMSNLHNDYSKDMTLNIQNLPHTFWFNKYNDIDLDSKMNGVFIYFRHIMANSVDTGDNNQILNIYSDNYDNFMAYISFYLDDVSYSGNISHYDLTHDSSVERNYHMYRLSLMLEDEVILSNKVMTLPEFLV